MPAARRFQRVMQHFRAGVPVKGDQRRALVLDGLGHRVGETARDVLAA